MVHCSFAQVILMATILGCVAPSHTASINVPWEKVSCLHRDKAERKYWKTCLKENPDNPSLPTYDNLGIADKISTNSFTEVNVPTNDMICYGVDRYDYLSLIEAPDCPALCKLRDLKEEDDGCDEEEEENVESYPESGITVVKSPNYNCSQYRRSEICIYNISMSCDTNHVVVSDQLSELDVVQKDFIQIVDYSKQTVYQPVSGSEWPGSRAHITSTNFAIVFWSNKDKKQGKGFKLHMECAGRAGEPTTETPAESGSATFEQQ